MIHLKEKWSSWVTGLLLLCLSQGTLGENRSIWQGETGHLKIDWTESDITAHEGETLLFSARALTKNSFEADFLTDHSLIQDNTCEYKRDFTLLSVVGSLASLEDAESISCSSMPHPSGTTQFTTIDLANSGQPVKLTDWFLEADILKALLADPLIQKALLQDQMNAPPKTLMALFELLEWSNIENQSCEYYLDQQLLTQFAFHHVKNNQVAIRLSLSSIRKACPAYIQLGLYLPIPTALKTVLNQAQMGKAGFLMERSKKIAGEQSTRISFSTSQPSNHNIPQPQTSFRITVQLGDTLYSIAKRYGHNIDELAILNDLQSPYQLLPGQTLLVNPPADGLPSMSDKTTDHSNFHTVAVGETLYSIAEHYGHSIEELASWNELSPPYDLQLGQQLKITKSIDTNWTRTYQNSIHPNLPQLTFKLIGMSMDDERVSVKTIEIYKKNEIQPFQTISELNTEMLKSDDFEGFVVEDMNFDGYRDIRLVKFLPTGPNIPYLYWMFEPQTQHFIFNSAFSDSEMTSPQFDNEKKQVLSTWREGCCRYGTNYYEIVDNKPLLVRQEEQQSHPENVTDIIQVIVRERVGDTMEVVTPPTVEEVTETAVENDFTEETHFKQRIITASGVRVRSVPKLSASVIEELNFGDIVKQLARSNFQDKIEQTSDYWYKIEMSGDKIGWIFGGLSTTFDFKQRATLYQQITQTRLQQPLNLPEQIDLTNFLARAKREVHSPPEIALELAFSHLLSLQKVIDKVDTNQTEEEASLAAWFKTQQQEDLIKEISGSWQINSEIVWHLHDQYYPLPMTDSIAWTGAKTTLNDECENAFECSLTNLNKTTVKYLKWHPHGQYVEEALKKIADFLDSYQEKTEPIIAETDTNWPRLLAVLHATVERCNHSQKSKVLGQIDQVKSLLETVENTDS